MKRYALLLLVLLGGTAMAQQKEVTALYEPSSINPYGKANPKAPKALQQFEFLVGTCDCVEQVLQKGEWKTGKMVWTGTYALNGMAIQDKFWNNEFAGTSMRIYDENTDEWRINFFRMPNNTPAEWVGKQDGYRMVLTPAPNAQPNTGTLETVFENITHNGFEWSVAFTSNQNQHTVLWKRSCTKRK